MKVYEYDPGFSPLMNIDKLILSRLLEGIGSAADHA